VKGELRVATDLISARPAEESVRNLVARWGGHQELFKDGFVGVPESFLTHYALLKPYSLTVSEAMFVVQLMAHKWTPDPPFPSYRTLAKRMGVTDKMARRYAVNLERKGFLKREGRIGGTNAFDLRPLFEILAKAVEAEKATAAERRGSWQKM
jgi:Helix-turn-helix domain